MQKNEHSIVSKTPEEVSRRDFLRICGCLSVAMGLPLGMGAKIAEAATSPTRPPVIWLSFQGCTGCTESLLRTTHPTFENLILGLISLDFNETLNAAAGHQAEFALQESIAKNKGKFILVVEGSIPTKDGGVYCKINGRPAIEILKEVGPQAAAVIAIGSCASWGGIPSSGPNPTGAVPAHEILKGMPVINVPGCPPNPYNFLSTVLYVLTFKKIPELDEKSRPKFAYGRLIHENCERRPHFDAGRFAKEFGDIGHRQGYCLYKLGCKGPETYANCPIIKFGDVMASTWPVGTGHPCFGCSEDGVGFKTSLHTVAKLYSYYPPGFYPHVVEQRGQGLSLGSAALVAGIGGAAIGAGAVITKQVMQEKEENEPGNKE